MTLVECFSDSLVENIIGCLRLRPDKVILLGDAARIHRTLDRFQNLLKRRGLKIKITPMDTRGKDMAVIAGMLSDIVRKEEQCVIDLNGGDEITVMAVGALVATMDDRLLRRVSVQRYDPQLGIDTDCDGDGRVIRGQEASLSVVEQIALHGGIVHPSSYQPESTYLPKDLDPLWDIVSDAPRQWNRDISALNEFEKHSESKTRIYLDLSTLPGKIKHNYAEKEARVLALLEKFRKNGVILDNGSHGHLDYTYTSPILRYCTQKAGNVLEVKSLLEARALKDNGAPFFRDCQTSVHIDWDGVTHDPSEHIPETRNEVDLVLTRGMTPLFISCKNGSIGEEELYKLNTVATRFGGPHARKMLIAADLDQKDEFSDLAYIQRAQDMGVYLVTDAVKLTKEQWRQIFHSALQPRFF